jgi:hypothetical protein
MAYRPYPNVDRARRQLLRGYSVEPPSMDELRAAMEGRTFSQEPGRYVLSTRPGVVGGTS